MLGQLNIHMEKSLDFYFTSHTEINSRWIVDEDMNGITIKFLEECLHESRQKIFKQYKSTSHRGKKLIYWTQFSYEISVWIDTAKGMKAKLWSGVKLLVIHILNKGFMCTIDR